MVLSQWSQKIEADKTRLKRGVDNTPEHAPSNKVETGESSSDTIYAQGINDLA